MYDYRKMTPEQKLAAVEYRRLHEHPLHSPPHLDFVGQRQFFITGTCFEHKHHIGLSPERMTNFEADLLTACGKFATSIYAWCVLPNHYHSSEPTTLRQCGMRLGCCTDALLTIGTARRIKEEGKSGLTALTELSSHMVIFGRASITSIIIRYNTVTLIDGKTGFGRVRRLFSSAWATRQR